MQIGIQKICSRLWEKLRREEGQDAIEYVLAASLIAMAATVGAKGLAIHINDAFGTIGANTNALLSTGGVGSGGSGHGGSGNGGGGNGGGGNGGGGNGGGGNGGGGNGGGGNGGGGN